ncbi:putative amino-acid metabolite efflux pump [Sulfurospirillum diekertiae]|uniref:Amino-acid metabolite efflux pump n=1 Tax=Sulfurospirillum diekertiae TaxID=1854492 RepID=A0A1Y0HP52_9BACT|nr:EamA family transporter [Sulfurospirillum diekertiae]ARU49115.1 putative amino-acid metabolite efflux pump [Sulfurospirillum diekertiae]
MPPRHILLALSVVVIWGVNFVVIQVALQELPPLLLTFLRFFFVAFPAVFFFKRPQNTSWKMLFYYSLSMFILDFAFLFSGMYSGVSSGIASLALQTQVFFTAILAVIFIKEKMTMAKTIGAMVAFSGIVFVGFHTGGDVNLLGLVLVECAALSWAIGNLVSKQIGKVDMLSLVVWGSFISLPFLLALSYIFESHLWNLGIFTHLTFKSIGAIVYLAYPVTFFWLWCLELVAESLPSHDRCSFYAFSTCGRIFCFSHFSRRSLTQLEAHCGLFNRYRAFHQPLWRSPH